MKLQNQGVAGINKVILFERFNKVNQLYGIMFNKSLYVINVSYCFRCVSSRISIILSEKICYMIDAFYPIVTLKRNKLLKEWLWYELIKLFRLALTQLIFTFSKSTIEILEKGYEICSKLTQKRCH